MKILIAGDSFAAEWPGKNGWVKLLKNDYEITNVAQAGVSEYKIYKQIKDINLNEYKYVIVSHTSPFRVHTLNHPLHKEGIHSNCDLLWSDIADRCSLLNPSLKAAQGYFKYHYDKDYYHTLYELFRKEIYTLLKKKKYLSISHLEIDTPIHETKHINFSKFWLANKGNENHYSIEGNQLVYKIIIEKLKTLSEHVDG